MDEPRWRSWLTGFDGTWRLEGNPAIGSATLSHRSGGAAGGVDYQINPHLLTGIAMGGADSLFSVPDRATSGSLVRAHLGTYRVAPWDSFYAAGAVSFAGIVNKMNRTISVGFSPAEMVTGNFNSKLLNGRLELGRDHRVGNLTVSPFAAVQYAELWQTGFTESSTTVTGAPGVLGLTYASKAISSLPTFLGVQVDARAPFANGMVWSPYVRVSWVHEFKPTRDIAAN